MKTPLEPATRPHQIPEIDRETSSRLLKMAVAGPRRPIDDLLARLEHADANMWLRETFRSRLFSELAIDQASLEAGKVPVLKLVQLKENAKKMVTPGADEQTRLRGLFGYFVSIAAARASHGQNISAKDPTEVRAALAELAGVTADRLAELFARASLPEG